MNRFKLNGKEYQTISKNVVLIRIKPIDKEQFVTKSQDKELIQEGIILAIPMRSFLTLTQVKDVPVPVTYDFKIGDTVAFKAFSARKRGTLTDELGTSDVVYVNIEDILDVEIKGDK